MCQLVAVQLYAGVNLSEHRYPDVKMELIKDNEENLKDGKDFNGPGMSHAHQLRGNRVFPLDLSDRSLSSV